MLDATPSTWRLDKTDLVLHLGNNSRLVFQPPKDSWHVILLKFLKAEGGDECRYYKYRPVECLSLGSNLLRSGGGIDCRDSDTDAVSLSKVLLQEVGKSEKIRTGAIHKKCDLCTCLCSSLRYPTSGDAHTSSNVRDTGQQNNSIHKAAHGNKLA